MRHDDKDRKDDADEALRQDVQRTAGCEAPAEEPVGAVLLGWIAFSQPVAEEREREPEADGDVGDGDAGEDEDAEAGEKNQRGIQTCAGGAERSAAEGFNRQCQCKHGEGQRQAGGGGVDAEELETGGHAPVEQRRFFEVADAVRVERDPVAADEHLAGDLGVDRVGVVEQRRRQQREAGVEEEPQRKQDKAIAGCAGVGSWAGYRHGRRGERGYAPSLPEPMLLVQCQSGDLAQL